MATGLLLLLDDIATILDDVAVLTKVAVKKTAGVLGDDLALNAQQVIGIEPNRELPVVWSVAKGSLVNKLILVPAALLLSSTLPWMIEPLLILGGAYLCFEGCEKLAHKFLHPEDAQHHRKEHEANIADAKRDMVAVEKTKIAGAIRTDFILSAEIVVISLGSVAHSPFLTRLLVLTTIGLLMTIGVYGLVAGIVKLDDLGARLIRTQPDQPLAKLRHRVGTAILYAAPYLMKLLSVGGTLAMFLVGGGILAHGWPWMHHTIQAVGHRVAEVPNIGGLLAWSTEMGLHGILGVGVGIAALLVVNLVKKYWLPSKVST